MMRKSSKIVLGLFALLLLFSLSAVYAARNPGLLDGVAAPGSFLERALARTPFSNRILCLEPPGSEVPFGSVDEAGLKSWIRTLRYTTNPQNLAVTDEPDGTHSMRQRFVPSDKGSERVVVSVNLRPARTYEVEQSVMFEPGFQWGGEVESGKFGYGLAGGSAPTGGKIADDGFSARFIWKGNGDGTASAGVYLYSVDRGQNLPYGDEFVVPGFTIRPGERFRVKMRLTANSSLEAKDGEIRIWIDDEPLFVRDGIQWQSAGDRPLIDQTLYSSFHGGNTGQWSPQDEVYARTADVCVFKERD